MTNSNYTDDYKAAARELEQLLEQQENIEKRILSARKKMNALAVLISEHMDSPDFQKRAAATVRELIDTSLTDDIHKIVLASDIPLTASEIREELKKLGGSLAEHSNPLATIHAITNRLQEAGKVKEVSKDGRKAWQASGHPAYKLKLRQVNPGASGRLETWLALTDTRKGK